jgi:hypothetical protein
VQATPSATFTRHALRGDPDFAVAGLAPYPAALTAADKAGTSGIAPGFHRTPARPWSNATSARSTPGTLCSASITCRAQLAQVIPVMANSLRGAT